MNRLTPKAEAFLLGHKAAHESVGAQEKAHEVDRDMAEMQRLGDALDLSLRLPSEGEPFRTKRAALRCAKCGGEFQAPTNRPLKYCSRRCRSAFGAAMWRARHR